MTELVLTLYISGYTAKSERAIRNLRKLFDDEDAYELKVVDVLENPQDAENEKILATPTLIRRLPPPMRRIIGDLSDTEQVLLGLELADASGAPVKG